MNTGWEAGTVHDTQKTDSWTFHTRTHNNQANTRSKNTAQQQQQLLLQQQRADDEDVIFFIQIMTSVMIFLFILLVIFLRRIWRYYNRLLH
jgi:hypothetical protein